MPSSPTLSPRRKSAIRQPSSRAGLLGTLFVTAGLACLAAPAPLGDAARAAPAASLAAAPRAAPSSRYSPRPPGRFTHVIQPELEGFFRFPAARRFRGRRLPGGPDAAETLDRVGVSIRLESAEALRHLLDAEDAELRLTRVDGAMALLGDILAARVTRQGLHRLAALPGVVRVELDMLSPLPPPLDLTAAEIQAHAVWATLDTAGLPVTGAGVIIADIDSGIDPFHPAFFRADGPYVDWIDVNGDGLFTPGVDAVDWNGNGVADSDESVGFFDGVAYNLHQFLPILDTDDGVFDLGWDHLFLVPDGDGQRAFGPEAGYGDETATFGERLLVPDDANRNGRLDPGERLVALGTPKILAVRAGNRTYLRDADLSEVPVTDDAMHGTGVSGILVGGQRGFTTLTGIAPEAELLMASTHDPGNQSGDLVPLLTWSAQQGAQVMLHEYAPWVGYHMDGSSNHEQLMDQAAAQGIAQVNPAGNLGGSMKHGMAAVPTQGALDLPLLLPAETTYGFLQIGLLWRDPERQLHLAIRHPGGELMDLGSTGTGNNGQVFSDGTTWVYAWRDDSPRGTAKLEAWVFGQQGMSYLPIASGGWTLALTDPETADATAPDVTVAAYVMDDVSGWGLGAHFPLHS
ncbi:MAG: S8 family serine peptidase, partial [Polyangia bacterium]|nr:S8 family serine peptidase [Polyangia bacterium]